MGNTTTSTENKAIFSNELFNDFANLLLNNGFTIVIPEKPSYWNYLHFVKNDKIGYCQLSYNKCGISFSTVHKGNRNCGTGFGLDDSHTGITNPTIEDAERAFINYPNWAKKQDREAVEKYKNLDDYLSKPLNATKNIITPTQN